MAVEVLIVGAGPTGLTCALLLAQRGVSCRVVERRSGIHNAPQAHVISQRTMEIYRSLDIDAAKFQAIATPPEDMGTVRWVTTLAGSALGAFQLATTERVAKILGAGPVPGANISQDLLEKLLLDEVVARGIPLDFDTEWLASTQFEGGVRSTLKRGGVDLREEVESRYLLACDGAASPVREALEIACPGDRSVETFLAIQIAADLRDIVATRPALLYWVMHPDAQGVFIAHDLSARWVLMQPVDPTVTDVSRLSESEIRDRVRLAIGKDHPFEVVSKGIWTMTAVVADKYRDKNIFLIGDSAHRFPPTGGMGLNTGVADAFNIAWKISDVLRGVADPGLLDSYEIERRPVAKAICATSLENHRKMIEVVAATGIAPGSSRDEIITRLEDVANDAGKLEKVQAAIDRQVNHFDMTGLDVGQCYEEGAIISDGSEVVYRSNPVADYVPNGRPGARLPHRWTVHHGEVASTIDLVASTGFTLFAGPEAEDWATAGEALGLQIIEVGKLGWDDATLAAWLGACEIDRTGALLIRPDQHIARRSRCDQPDARQRLSETISSLARKGERKL